MTDDELEQRALENIRKLQQHLLGFTCKLVRLNRAREVEGVASGFFVDWKGSWFLLSAGHALKNPNWFIETDVFFTDTHQTLLFAISDVMFFEAVQVDENKNTLTNREVEFAFGKLDKTKLEKAIAIDPRLKGKQFEFPLYKGSLSDAPISTDYYSYASWNDVCLNNRTSKAFLRRSSTQEFGMEYLGLDDSGDLYRFKPQDGHKGHDYYRGASGSPIVDPEGKVVSMLISGCEKKNELYGLRLPKFVHLLDVQAQA